jgi:diguanylate cyclase (GGDEF)-like protein
MSSIRASPPSSSIVAEAADHLTGLPTRGAFERCLLQSLSDEGQHCALLLIDLDRFKTVNDELGHVTGDILLQRVGSRLRAAVRSSDAVFRFGGDEFAVLLRLSDTRRELIPIATRIIELMKRSFLIEGQLVHIGCSIGVAIAPEHGSGMRELINRADLALYEAKSNGGNCHVQFVARLQEKEFARRNGEQELRRALALRQFELHYQPQVDDKNGLIGFEALIRWRHPERGLVPPLEFLSMAERIGLMGPIGEWVLRAACEEATRWPAHIRVAVNASASQVDDASFAEIVRRALKAAGLPGSRLEIEITEEAIFRNANAAMSAFASLREQGVTVAIDDFGTGYSSLSQLAHFPFDRVKIDRSLAGVDGDHPRMRALVRAIASLGKGLGLNTLAEGVENEGHLARLKEDGCEAMQGYFIGRPAPADQLPAIIEKFSPASEGQLAADERKNE